MLSVLNFLKAHWTKLGWAAPVLLVTTVKGCAATADLKAKLTACEAKPAQVVTVAAKARQDVRIVYRDGSPCPDVTATNESEATAVVAQAQPTPCPLPPAFGIGVNAGYHNGLYVGPSLDWKWLGVDGKWSPKTIGGGVRLTLRF